MPRDVARATLYRGTINLWVEDILTRTYLSEIWNDSSITFLIGGGNEGVKAIVQDAEDAGYHNVFAVTDRDYRPSNRAGWRDPNKTYRTFILPVHEIENYLLQAAPLAQSRYHNLGLTTARIEEFLHEAASRLCWWASCRSVVAELKRRFREEFIGDPKQSVTDEASARAHICQCPWFQKLSSEVANSTEAHVYRLLGEAHSAAKTRLDDGTWRNDFAGKEILRDVTSRICDRTTILRFPASDAEFYADIAKEVAVWQVANDAVHPDFAELLAALKERIARRLATPPS